MKLFLFDFDGLSEPQKREIPRPKRRRKGKQNKRRNPQPPVKKVPLVSGKSTQRRKKRHI
jgi:hypothetical protein